MDNIKYFENELMDINKKLNSIEESIKKLEIKKETVLVNHNIVVDLIIEERKKNKEFEKFKNLKK